MSNKNGFRRAVLVENNHKECFGMVSQVPSLDITTTFLPYTIIRDYRVIHPLAFDARY